MMKNIGILFMILSLILWADNFVVIANRENIITTVTREQLKRIYLKKRRFWGESKLIALNLPADNSLRKSFEYNILRMNHSQLENYWLKQHYKGQRPPYQLKSVKSVILFVKRVKGAIGYIPASLLDKDVKIIYKSSK